MTIANQAELNAAIPLAKSGDVLVLAGTFAGFPLKNCAPGLTFDCTNAVITGNTYTKNLSGCAFVGGRWTGSAPLRVDGGSDISLRDALLTGPAERLGTALAFSGVTGVTISGTAIKEYRNGVSLYQVDGARLKDVGIEGMGQDAVHLLAVWNSEFRGLRVHGTRRLTADTHGDGVQILSAPGLKPTGNLLFEDSEFTGDMQGLVTTMKAGDGGFDNITVRRVRTCVAFSGGLVMGGVRVVTVDECAVETYPMALYQSKLYVAGCTDVKWVGRNTQAPYRNKKAVAFQ